MLLDIVDVGKSHSGLNLAVAFAKILDDFEISDKGSYTSTKELQNFKLTESSSALPVITRHIMIR